MWGFIDTTGKITIDSQFEFVTSFHDGLCLVGDHGGSRRWFIDKLGRKAFAFDADYRTSVEHFSEGMAAVRSYDWNHLFHN